MSDTKTCLHLVSLSADNPQALAQLDTLLGEGDAILLLGAGLALAEHFHARHLPVYCWSDSQPGGLSDDEAATLLFQYDKSASWHD